MRNLKRVLSLALALVMVLGMMVITTSAATFTDAEETTYTEAVDVVSAIGVIDGFEAADGTFYFNPTETLTREQGAKMLCYLLLGKSTADKLTGSGNFTDVAATRWSAGAIDYCASLGILVGMGDGTFDPTGKLTGVQYGKMLLCALGYDAKIEGYEGKDWAVNIAVDMLSAGLTHEDIALDQPLTREAAAQMTFQALTADMVKYLNKGTSITVGGVEIVSGASEASLVAETGYDNYNLTTTTANLQLCEKYAPNLKLKAGTADAYGRPASHCWFIDVDKNDLWTANKDTVVANIMKTAAYTYDVTGRQDTTLALIADKLELDINGAVMANAVKGDTVELYLNAAGEIATAVKLHTELGKIAKVAKTTDVDAKYTYDITVKTESGNNFYTDKTLTGFDFDTMVKDTYVTIVKGTNAATVALADSITGKQTAKGTGYTKIDGVQTYYAGSVWTSDSNAVNYTDTFNFYVDAKGLIIGTEKAAAAKVDTNIFYIDSYKFELGNTFKADTAKLAVINLDGTKEVLEMNITVTSGTKYVNKTTELADDLTYADGFYAYTLTEDGKVATLKAVGTSGSAVTGVKNTKELSSGTIDFTAKKADVDVAGTTLYATTTTELVVISTVYQEAVTITGYTNFDGTDYVLGTDATAVLYTYDADVLKTIYVLGASVSVIDDAVNGWLVEKGDEFEIPGYSLTFQNLVYNVKGEEVTYVAIEEAHTLEDGVTVYYPEFAEITVVDGFAYLVDATVEAANEDVEKVTDTYIVIDGTPYYFASDVAYYDVTNVAKNGVVADDGVVEGDIITFTTKMVAGNKVVSAVYTTYAAQEDGVVDIDLTAADAQAYYTEVLNLEMSYLNDRVLNNANCVDYVLIQYQRPAVWQNVTIVITDGTAVHTMNLNYNGNTNATCGYINWFDSTELGVWTYTIKVDNVVVQAGSFEVE